VAPELVLCPFFSYPPSFCRVRKRLWLITLYQFLTPPPLKLSPFGVILRPPLLPLLIPPSSNSPQFLLRVLATLPRLPFRIIAGDFLSRSPLSSRLKLLRSIFFQFLRLQFLESPAGLPKDPGNHACPASIRVLWYHPPIPLFFLPFLSHRRTSIVPLLPLGCVGYAPWFERPLHRFSSLVNTSFIFQNCY